MKVVWTIPCLLKFVFSIPALLIVSPRGLDAAEIVAPDAVAIGFFESKIRPVLVENCYKCHSAEAEKVKGGLLVDSRESIRKGGDTGPAVVPGDPGASLLLAAIAHADPDLEMPPKKEQLSAAIIKDFESWIEMGAPDPREGGSKTVAKPPVDIEAGRRFWAFIKPAQHPFPVTTQTGWAERELDHFVLARLEEHGLAPSPDADPATLLRRLHFDITGLPPAPKELGEFLREYKKARAADRESAKRRDGEAATAGAAEVTDSSAVSSLIASTVDRLLSSPEFGPRWGRHWLDVARFAESNGKESNLTYPHAWRYRDYVIDSFNAGKPFDQFIVEQIAGDLLPCENDEERANLLIATGFLALGPKGLNEMNRDQFNADLADEQIDTVTRSITASSVACARCHDHKFDPFGMEDYYALAGIFASTRTCFGTAIGSENNVGGDLLRLPDLRGQLIPNKPLPPEKVAQLKAQVAALNKEEDEGRAAVMKAVSEGKSPEGLFTLRDALRILWTRGGLEGQLKTIDDEGNALPLAMGVSDHETVGNVPLLDRGEIAHPGKRVPRRFPRVIEIEGAELPPPDQSGRLELARWLTSPDHPLTARVMANRVWRHLFGAGIVATMDNFGFNGERPSHPELLDYLALKFVEDGWSVKSLIREIVLSRAYRQASAFREDYFEKDPANRYLWRASKRRLDAEAIRDAMLAVSGELDSSRRPGSLVADIGDKTVALFGFMKDVPADLDGSLHRSVYLPVVRDRLPDVLELFDFAEPSLVTGDRDTTNVPLQALYLMNSPFVQDRAAALARRVLRQADTREKQIQFAFRLCFSRPPDAREAETAAAFLQGGAEGEEDEHPGDRELQVMTDYCQALLSTAEFRNLD